MASSFGTSRAEEWERLTPPDLFGGFPVLDTKRGILHMLPLGDRSQPGEEWILALDHPDHWQRIIADGEGPRFDFARGAIYDPGSDRILVLAGETAGSSRFVVWARSLSQPDGWRILKDDGPAPVARADYSLVFDRHRSEYVLFGGAYDRFNSPQFNDLWRLRVDRDQVEWQAVATTGDSLASRSGAGAIYDDRRDRMVLFGGGVGLGSQGSLSASGDVISIQFGDITSVKLDPADPNETSTSIVSYAYCTYDSIGDKMVITAFDAWAPPVRTLDLGDLETFATVVSSGTPNELRTYWATAERSGRSAIAMTGPVAVNRVDFGPPYTANRIGPPDDQIKQLASPAPIPTFPDGRDGSFWLWAGFLGRDPALSKFFWRFAPSDLPHWSRRDLSGEAPRPRNGSATAYDARHDRWFVFGGNGATSDSTFAYLDELWTFEGATKRWSKVDAGSQRPPARVGGAIAYDGLRDRLILYGGRVLGHYARDLWTWTQTSGWKPMDQSERHPSDRAGAVAAYDPSSDRLILHGGEFQPSTGIGFSRSVDDTWLLTFGAPASWDSLTAAPPGDDAGWRAFGTFDPARRSIDVLEGRRSGPGAPAVVLKQLHLDGSPRWSDVVVGGLGSSTAAGFDFLRDRLVSMSGGRLLNAWKLERSEPAQLAFVEPQSKGGGPFEVALLGSPLLDVQNVDPATCTLGGQPARSEHRSERASLRDSNSDGYLDRLVRFDPPVPPTSGIVEFDALTKAGVRLVAYTKLAVIDRSPFSASGDPDSPTDTVRPLAVFASGFERGAGVLRLDLPARARVVVDIFAVSGRRVVGRDLEELDAGSHEVGDLGLGDAAAGVYFVRARAGGAVAQARFISIP